MAYTKPWDESVPDGNEAASTIDTIIKDLKISIRERMEDIFPDWDDDAVDPKESHKAKVTISIAQSIANNTPTNVIWDVESFDIGAMVDLAAQPTRITIVDAGHYLFVAYGVWVADVDGYREMRIKDSLSVTLGGSINHSNSATIATPQSASAIAVMAASDYVTLEVTHTAGAALNFGGAGIGYLSAVRLA